MSQAESVQAELIQKLALVCIGGVIGVSGNVLGLEHGSALYEFFEGFVYSVESASLGALILLLGVYVVMEPYTGTTQVVKVQEIDDAEEAD